MQHTKVHTAQENSSLRSLNSDELIAQFASPDYAVRKRAREAVVKMGNVAVASLVKVLHKPISEVRWEATKALAEICDPTASPALIGQLGDPDSSIRWVAADGLFALGRLGLEPLLHALVQDSDSVLLRQGAHRVLYILAGRKSLQDALLPVVAALESVDPAIAVPFAAYNAINALRILSAQDQPGITIQKVTVQDWMTPNPYTIVPLTTLSEAYNLMKKRSFRRLPVVFEGRLLGIVSLGDLREAMAPHPGGDTGSNAMVTVEQIMTRDVVTIAPQETLRAAAERMLQRKIGCLPVVSEGKLVGIISESNIFRVLVHELPSYR
jgi:CBS domain-containing protein